MKVSIGRIVHYVQKQPPQYGDRLVHLPAIVTAVWGDTCVNLQVFTDGHNSEPLPNDNPQSVKWVTSVTFDEFALRPDSWHWPERIEETAPPSN